MHAINVYTKNNLISESFLYTSVFSPTQEVEKVYAWGGPLDDASQLVQRMLV